ncbi:MAG: YidC/Oxa1 family membrane protein insertase, partial [Clostridia bacterium]|nr:YidC/Oxa1 family membrane protein insertase [Clostridia bacterium]
MNIPIVTDVFAFIMQMIMKMLSGANGVNFAIAILLFTLIVKLLLFPLQLKSKKGMLDQQRLQPEIKKLEKKYGSNKQKYQEEVSKLYKKEGVSLMGGCLPTMLTLVIVLGLYTVIYRPVTHLMEIEKDNGSILAISQDLIELKDAGLYKVDGKTLADCTTEEEKQEYQKAVDNLFQVGNDKGFVAMVEQESEKAINQVKVARLMYGNIDALNEKLAAEKAEAEAAGTEYTAPYSTENFFDINFGLFGLDLGDQPSYKPVNVLVILPIISGLTSFLLSWVTQYYQKANTPASDSKKSSSGISPQDTA